MGSDALAGCTAAIGTMAETPFAATKASALPSVRRSAHPQYVHRKDGKEGEERDRESVPNRVMTSRSRRPSCWSYAFADDSSAITSFSSSSVTARTEDA